VSLQLPFPPRLIDRDDLPADFLGLLRAREHAEKQGLLFVEVVGVNVVGRAVGSELRLKLGRKGSVVLKLFAVALDKPPDFPGFDIPKLAAKVFVQHQRLTVDFVEGDGCVVTPL